MPTVTWTYVTSSEVAPPTTVSSIVSLVDFAFSLPVESDKVIGSRSWVLVNKSGTPDMIRGEMDIVFQDGHVREVTDPNQVLDQRVRKCIVDVRGRNKFAANWGSKLRSLVGQKNLSTATLKEIGKFLREMTDGLIDSQDETTRRIRLADAELIDSIDRIDLMTEGSDIVVHMNVVTREGKTVNLSMVVQPGGGVISTTNNVLT